MRIVKLKNGPFDGQKLLISSAAMDTIVFFGGKYVGKPRVDNTYAYTRQTWYWQYI